MKNKADIERFFDDYADRFNKVLDGAGPDLEATVDAFAECFIEASPVGINCGKNDEAFRKAIPVGYDFYRKIGTQRMDLVRKDIQPLDDFHTMARIHWNAVYANGKEIEFDVIYFVQDLGGGPKIFTYITGDEQKALEENGLIPES